MFCNKSQKVQKKHEEKSLYSDKFNIISPSRASIFWLFQLTRPFACPGAKRASCMRHHKVLGSL